MANLPKLNSQFANAAKQLTDRKIISPSVKHDWTTMRHLVWAVLRAEVLPEFGIDPSKAAMVKGSDGKEVPNEVLENMTNARKAFDTAFDDGYTLESSNCGKHLAAHGFVRSADKEAAVASQVFV